MCVCVFVCVSYVCVCVHVCVYLRANDVTYLRRCILYCACVCVLFCAHSFSDVKEYGEGRGVEIIVSSGKGCTHVHLFSASVSVHSFMEEHKRGRL